MLTALVFYLQSCMVDKGAMTYGTQGITKHTQLVQNKHFLVAFGRNMGSGQSLSKCQGVVGLDVGTL